MRGTILKRGKTYSYVCDVGRDETGKRIQKTKGGFLRKTDAQRALNELIIQVQQGAYRADRLETVADYMRRWQKEYVEINLAPNTINGYRVEIEKRIIPFLGKTLLQKLTPVLIQSFYAKLINQGYSGTTVVYTHRVLHEALKHAVRLQIILTNPSDLVDPPRKSKNKYEVLTEVQAKRLMELIHDSELLIPVTLGLLLGLRRGEVLGLRWSDFDFSAQTVTINHSARYEKGNFFLEDTKTVNSRRTLLLSSSLLSIFNEEQNRQEQMRIDDEYYNALGLVVCRKDGSIMSTNALNHMFREVIDKNDFPHIRFHDLRHSYATLLLKKNIPAKIASQRLGHSTIGITLDLYSHVSTEMQGEAAIALDNLF